MSSVSDIEMVPIAAAGPIARTKFISRLRGERLYGRRLAALIQAIKPEIVLSNAPVDAQAMARSATHQTGGMYLHWLQDIYSRAMADLLPQKLTVGGATVARIYRLREENLLRSADGVIAITDDFIPYLHAAGLDSSKIHVIENWAPIASLPMMPRQNSWADNNGLGGGLNFIYTGTLAMKHDPDLLLALALEVGNHDGRVVVVSEGSGADFLRREADARKILNVRVLPFQPFEAVSQIMGSADVLVALLRASAGTFSVPSKVLSYLCAGRAILASMPAENQAAQVIIESQSGLVVPAGDFTELRQAAKRLACDANLRDQMGAKARYYAEHTFDVSTIADRFTQVMESLRPTR